MDIDAESPEFVESPGPTLFRAALCLCSNVMDGATSIPFLPKPTDIRSDQAASAQVPTPLFNFLAWLLLGDNASQGLSLHEKVELASESDRCHVLSVAQDIIHCVTRGRIKNCQARRAASRNETHFWKRKSCVTSKSLWAWPVSHTNAGGWSRDGTATDCAEVLQYRKGCVCAIKHSARNIICSSLLDNNDLLEETLTGIGTTHCTNGIAIQRQVQLAMPQTQSECTNAANKQGKTAAVDCYPAWSKPGICGLRGLWL